MYHHAIKHLHANIVLSIFSTCIYFFLKCATIFFENRFTNKELMPKNNFEGFLHGEIESKVSHCFTEKKKNK